MDGDNVRRFISQMKGQLEYPSLTTINSSPTTQHDQKANGTSSTVDTTENKHISDYNTSGGAKTPPRATVASQDHHQMTSSPHISGITAPQNTPKTAVSSPHLTNMNTHNQDVADAFSDFVNNMNGRPLSESMWAPGSTRDKPSMRSGARSAKFLTPVKTLEPNPAINDTFDRMSFKAADADHRAGKNLIGEHNTQSLFSKAPPSFVNKLSLLPTKIHGDKVDDVQVKPEAESDENLKPSAHTESVEKVQAKASRANEEKLSNIAYTDRVKEESDVSSTSKAYMPPHLRATRGSSQNSVKTETNLSYAEDISPVVTSKTADSDAAKDAIRAATNGVESKIITDSADTKPLTDVSAQSESLEHQTFFKTWPKLEERSRPGKPDIFSLPVIADRQTAAKTRKVIIKDLPRGSTATFVASLVYGGPIEEMHIRSSAAGDLSAVVRFMDAGDCMKFYNETSNGLVYKKDAKGRELVLFVELSKDVDVVGGLLQGWIISGVTRCVRAVGVEAEWGMDGLLKMAERKNRKVEKIADGYNAGGVSSHLTLVPSSTYNTKPIMAGAFSRVPFL